jgi:hypothetical protein
VKHVPLSQQHTFAVANRSHPFAYNPQQARVHEAINLIVVTAYICTLRELGGAIEAQWLTAILAVRDLT